MEIIHPSMSPRFSSLKSIHILDVMIYTIYKLLMAYEHL